MLGHTVVDPVHLYSKWLPRFLPKRLAMKIVTTYYGQSAYSINILTFVTLKLIIDIEAETNIHTLKNVILWLLILEIKFLSILKQEKHDDRPLFEENTNIIITNLIPVLIAHNNNL